MTKARPDIPRYARLGVTCLLLAAALIFHVGTAQPAEAADVPPNPLEKAGWILDRHDEFNGSLDTSLWITNYLESRTTETRSRARYGFRNNALVLRIDNDQPTYYADNPMKVSSIQTGQMTGLHKTSPFNHTIPTIWKYTAKYGYFEIRAKTSARSGLHAAFWTVGRQDTSTQNSEIDIMEHPGRTPRNFNYSLHRWADPNVPEVNHNISVGFDLASEMHIYALEWTPTQIKLYVDNALKSTINASPGYPWHSCWASTRTPDGRDRWIRRTPGPRNSSSTISAPTEVEHRVHRQQHGLGLRTPVAPLHETAGSGVRTPLPAHRGSMCSSDRRPAPPPRVWPRRVARR